jgi:predicted RNA-binding protein
MRYALYAAETDETAEWLDDLKAEMADVCGGYTAYEAEGGWYHDGELITDDVLVVETYTQGRDEIAFNLLKDYAHFIVGNTSEDSVMVVAGDNPVYIE